MDHILYFQDTELVKSAQLLLGQDGENLKALDRETYLSFLEQDYLQRMAEEHKDEKGIFGRIDAPRFVDADALTEYTNKDDNARLGDFLSNRMEHLMDDESILKNIDKDIKQIADAQANTETKRKNLKAKVGDEE